MVLVATQVKRRRGTNNENDAFAGAEGEITVDLTNKELRVHDGSGKKGGFRIGHYSYSSNCITEIPQDIKLELNNGTLTLKAGSKIYVPNGAGVFDLITTTQDCSMLGGIGAPNNKVFIAYKNNAITSRSVSSSVSGAGATTAGGFAFDTTTNKINFYNASGALQSADWSFPIAIVSTDSSGVASSIDQIFNGFGYIGSTVFVLPNVKFLVPEGRNADGSLKNTLTTVQQVITKTIPSNTGWHYCTFNRLGTNFDFATELYVGTSLPTNAKNYSRFYNIETNKMYLVVSGTATEIQTFTLNARIEHETSAGFQISSMKQAEVFHAIDYSETEYIAHQAMPSDKYINLTAGASGTYYTAPTDGYFYIRGTATGGYALLRLNYDAGEDSLGMIQEHSISGYILGFCIPVKKNRTVFLAYNSVNITAFRFYYDNGAQ